MGSCGDPFPFNVTEPEVEAGIHVVACPSGWCGKMIEGTTGAFRTDGKILNIFLSFISKINLKYQNKNLTIKKNKF